MIGINLLPQEGTTRAPVVKSSSDSSGALVVAGGLIAAYAVVFIAAFIIYSHQASVIGEEKRLDARNKKALEAIQEIEEEYRDLSEALAVAKNQIVILESLDPEDRLFWAEKMNILPKLVPDGVYVTELRVNETVREVETPDSRQRRAAWRKQNKKTRGPEPRRITQPIITQTLQMRGVSYVADGTSDERLSLIVDFVNTLQDSEVDIPFSGEKVSFIDNFNKTVPFSEVRGNRIQERDVTNFMLTLLSMPMGASES